MPIEERGEFPSVRGGQGLPKRSPGTRGLGPQEGLSGPGGWVLEGAEGLESGGGAGPSGDRTDVRTFIRTDGRKFPLCSIGHRPLWVRCPKGGKGKREGGKMLWLKWARGKGEVRKGKVGKGKGGAGKGYRGKGQ